MECIELAWGSELYQHQVQLRDRLLRKPLGLSLQTNSLEEEQDQWHFGILDDVELVACVITVPQSRHHAKLRQMCVDTPWQKKGVGKRLLEFAERTLLERGFQTIELHARSVVSGFYERSGYQKQANHLSKSGSLTSK